MIQRTTVAFFGRTNAGKSHLVNAIASQNVSIVSEKKGTTTDPVKKVMELLPLGPVTLVDTAGIDDESELGKERTKRSREILDSAQIAVLVVDASLKEPISVHEKKLLEAFKEKNIPFLVACNKCDLLSEFSALQKKGEKAFDIELLSAENPNSIFPKENAVFVSAKSGFGIEALKEKIAALKAEVKAPKAIASDLVPKKSTVILVIPIDESAPKDRLILPQQMILREFLEEGIFPLCCQPKELLPALKKLSEPPSLVITDSQAFSEVNKALSKEIPLTSFSILMARFKGTLDYSLKGAAALDSLKDGDKILISEGCTHHRQCADIGTVKLPAWISEYTKKKLSFEFTSGGTFPKDLSAYKAVIHCGGCMLNQKEMQNRILCCKEHGVPVTNYGIAIAKTKGILEHSLEILQSAL